MKKAFYISGGNGSILQVWDKGLEIDADSVSEAADVDVINAFMISDEWDNVEWQDEPYASDFSVKEIEEYVG